MSFELTPDNKIKQSLPQKADSIERLPKNNTSVPSDFVHQMSSEESFAISNAKKQLVERKFNSSNKTNRKFLKNEIIQLSYKENQPLFSLEEADNIITKKDDYDELYKILQLLKENNIKLFKDDYEEWLSDERTTSELLEQKIALRNELINNKIFAKIKEKYGEDILTFGALDTNHDNSIEQIQKNVEILEMLKKSRPELYKNILKSFEYFDLRFILDNKSDKEYLAKLLNSGLINDELPHHSLLNFLATPIKHEQLDKNIEILKYLKNNPKTYHLFKEHLFDSKNGGIIPFITQKISPDFDITKKEGVINLLSEMETDPQTAFLLSTYDKLDLILSERDDSYDDGKYISKYIKNNINNRYNIRDLFKNIPFKDSVKFLQSVKNPDIFNEFCFIFGCLGEIDTNKLNNFTKILEYTMTKNSLKENKNEIYIIMEDYLKEKPDEKTKIFNDIEKCKSIIDKLDTLKKELPHSVFSRAITPIFLSLISEKDIDIKQQNVEFLDELINDKNFENFSWWNKEVFAFITTECNLEKLKENKKILINSVSENNINPIDTKELLFYNGNTEKICEKYKELNQKYPNNVYFKINKDNNNVIFSYYHADENIRLIYDKNMELLSEQRKRDIGNDKMEAIIFDKVHNTEHKIIIKKISDNDSLSHAEKIISRYFDNQGKVIKTKCYNESCIDGTINIKEQKPNEEIKTLAKTKETPLGSFTEKELTSCDGTKSIIKSHVGVNGNESYTYRIVDKEGNELLNHNRWRKVVDDNTILYGVNGIEYKTVFSSNKIMVTNISNGDETIIDLDKLCPLTRKKHIIKMLKAVPADELIKIDKYVKALDWSQTEESNFNPVKKTITTGANIFIFEHEFGHAKDYTKEYTYESDFIVGEILNDKKLQEIYNQELENLKKNEPDCIREVVNYFTEGPEEHNTKNLSGLSEIIAETNAIQATPKAHLLLQMRTQILQEYFPRTIAYLIKNHLAV